MSTRIVLLLLAASVLGCSHEPAGSGQTTLPVPAAVPAESDHAFTHVITSETEYYTTGPQQARPPDGTIKAGTRVNLIEDAGSYCRVRTENGVEGFVAADTVQLRK